MTIRSCFNMWLFRSQLWISGKFGSRKSAGMVGLTLRGVCMLHGWRASETCHSLLLLVAPSVARYERGGGWQLCAATKKMGFNTILWRRRIFMTNHPPSFGLRFECALREIDVVTWRSIKTMKTIRNSPISSYRSNEFEKCLFHLHCNWFANGGCGLRSPRPADVRNRAWVSTLQDHFPQHEKPGKLT